MRSFSDNEVLDTTERLPTFKGWRKGAYLICVRSSADKFDAFDDRAFLYTSNGGRPKFIMAATVTTNSGSYGLLRFNEYNHLGCAVLKSDCMVYDSHVWGLHKGKKLAYKQSKGFPYYRDSNRNRRADEIGKVYTDVIGANIHRSGVDSTVIKNWSTACQVFAQEKVFLKFLDYMKSLGKPPLTLVILKESSVSVTSPSGITSTTSAGVSEQKVTTIPTIQPAGDASPTRFWQGVWKFFSK